jgi:Ca2+-dependent lipid-binding protein
VPAGILTVLVIRASVLESNDVFGMPDPYVALSVPSGAAAVTGARFNTRHPEFCEELQLALVDGDDVLRVELWDSNPGADDLKGEAGHPLGRVAADGREVAGLVLVDPDAGVPVPICARPSVLLELRFSPA